MTWVEYKYSGEFSEVVGNIVYRPIIGVKIKYGNETEETIAMIDSGTDVTVVDSNLAKLLGIDSTKYKKCKVAGVTGEAKGFVAKIKISIENFVRMYNQLKEYTNFTKFTKIVFLQNTYLNFLTKSALLR